MNVSAIIVTRGNVDLTPIIDSFPEGWEVIEWDNGHGVETNGAAVYRHASRDAEIECLADVSDLSVYGRYAAIEYASHDLIYVQDDDVIVSDPQAIVDRFNAEFCGSPGIEHGWDGIVANMPTEFRHDGYTDSCLVGFGAAFHRDAPRKAFLRYNASRYPSGHNAWADDEEFQRTCDVVFTTLTPRVLVDVPKTNMRYATNSTRMYRQSGHFDERTRMLVLARTVRDG